MVPDAWPSTPRLLLIGLPIVLLLLVTWSAAQTSAPPDVVIDSKIPPVDPDPPADPIPPPPALLDSRIPPNLGDATSLLPQIPARPSRTQAQIEEFVQEVSSRDAAVEVIVGQGRLVTLQEDLIQPDGADPYVAIGDPTVVEFDFVGPRHIRLTGQRIGVTDLSIVTSESEDYNLEVHVVPDLDLLRARLLQAFPDANVSLTPMREHVVVSGQARDAQQVTQILMTVEAFLESVQVSKKTQGASVAGPTPGAVDPAFANRPDAPLPADPEDPDATPIPPEPQMLGRVGGDTSGSVELPASRVINLLRVPGPKQVLLRVQVAELNRTAFRQLGVSFLFQNAENAIGSQFGPPLVSGDGAAGGAGTLLELLDPAGVPLFGIFDSGRANFLIQALRSNQVLKILAEPNLVAMDGQLAQFLSGGEFPVPVPQPGAGGSAVTIQYREFGVGVEFIPYILDDEVIRLSVAPEVSSLDFASGVTISGVSVPGLNTRRTSTVVEMREGQTLAISGILQIEMSGDTQRIPGLGDLPYIGSFFRNTTNRTVEKELVILVTPFLVQPMEKGVEPCLPGDDVLAPDDFELFLLGRIERRRPSAFRAPLAWDDPLGYEKGRWRGDVIDPTAGYAACPPGEHLVPPPQWQIEQQYIQGPAGYSP